MTCMAKRLANAGLLVTLVSASAVPASAPPGLTLAAAQRMISECTTLAVAQKFPPLSIVVLDAAGAIIAFERQDGASPASADAALQKAKSALRARVPTSKLANLSVQDQVTRDGLMVLGILGIPGGVPFPGDATVPMGAVGVSGAEPATDERCAGAAAAAFDKPGH